METLYTLAKVHMAVILVGSCIFLTLQAVAYRRYRHVSFLWLFLSTAIGLAGLFVASITYFVRDLSLSAQAAIHTLHLLMTIGTLIPGTWGTYLLFRAYGRLHVAQQDAGRTMSP